MTGIDFIIYELLQLIIIWLVAYFIGRLVKYNDLRVNYSRKIIHFISFFIPLLLWRVFPYDESILTGVFASILGLISLLLFIKPIRKKVTFIQIMFLSIDRPEDRPFTLLWFSTQIAVGTVIVLISSILFFQFGLADFILIPTLIIAFGDGLAEPVGIYFGKHRYVSTALFTKRKYYRTVEGSVCVFLTTFLLLLFFKNLFSPLELIISLICLPIIMTFTEAISPHTWDTPFLYFFGYFSLFIIKIFF